MTSLAAKGGKLVGILSVPAWCRVLLCHRVAAGVEHTAVLRHLGEVRMVVDIGANRGQFALVARHYFPVAYIVSFEPIAGPAAIYRTVFARDTRAELHETAIGPESKDTIIHLSARDDSSSMLPIATVQDALFPGTAEIGTRSIKVTRLADQVPEDAIETPALLKLDVQGFELEALAGCEDLLDCFDWVYAECSFVELYAGQAFADAVIAWLRERSFALRGVYNTSYDAQGRTIQADFLFGRQS